MPLPEVEYYALGELSKRWRVPKKRVRHYLETRALDGCVWLKPCWMQCGELTRRKNGEEVFHAHERRWVKGIVRLRAEDCHWVFRNHHTEIRRFGSLKNPDIYLQLENKLASLIICRQDVIIRAKDVRSFESRNGIQIKCNTIVRDSLDRFQHSDNYETVRISGKEFRFGWVQATIVKQLHLAFLSGNPWVHGKILLDKAGSQSQQLKNVFSSKANWRDCIESDRRGYYRLKL